MLEGNSNSDLCNLFISCVSISNWAKIINAYVFVLYVFKLINITMNIAYFA